MNYTSQEAVDKLLNSYKVYYDIHMTDELDASEPELIARCDFYEHAQKYVLSKKAELWATKCEEFLYLFHIDELTMEAYQRCLDFAYKDGNERANIGPNHMYTYITPIFICNTYNDEILKALKKCNLYKSFRLSLYGWLDVHVAILEVSNNKIYTNRNGRRLEKVLKNVLFNTKKKRRLFT